MIYIRDANNFISIGSGSALKDKNKFKVNMSCISVFYLVTPSL
jgi:hypothetical protein